MSPSSSAPRWLRSAASTVTFCGVFADALMFMTFVPIIPEIYSSSMLLVGGLVSLKALAQTICNPVASFMVHHAGAWRTGLIGTAVYTLALFAFSISEHEYYLLCISIFCMGFAGTCVFNGFQEGSTRLYPPEEKGFASSFALQAIGLGAALGAGYGGIMYYFVGYFWTFFLIVLWFALVTFFTIIVMSVLKIKVSLTARGQPAAIAPTGDNISTDMPRNTSATSPEEDSDSVLQAFTKFITDFFTSASEPRIATLFTLGCIESTMSGTFITVLSYYLTNEVDGSGEEDADWTSLGIGLTLSALGISFSISSFLMGKLADRSKLWVTVFPFLFSPILSCFVSLTTALPASYASIFPLCAAVGFLLGFVHLPVLMCFMRILDGSPVAFTLADMFVGLGLGFGTILGDVLVVYLPSYTDGFLTVTVLGVSLSLVCLACGLRYRIFDMGYSAPPMSGGVKGSSRGGSSSTNTLPEPLLSP